MKRLAPYALLFTLIFLLAFQNRSPDPAAEVITVPAKHPAFVMIDPGHGGYDPGVRSADLKEADLTLAIGKELQTALAELQIAAVMTRETDTDYATRGSSGKTAKRSDLNRRMDLAFEQGATLFLSLHVNASSQATRGGAEVFYSEQLPEAKLLAESVQSKLHQLPEMSRREAKPASYYLLENLPIPSLIIECGYLNITGDRAHLTSPLYQKKLAQAIALGVEEYLKSQ